MAVKWERLILFWLFIIFLFMCVCVNVCHRCAGALGGQQRTSALPWSGVTGSCEPTDMGVGNLTLVSAGTVMCSSPLSHLPRPRHIFFQRSTSHYSGLAVCFWEGLNTTLNWCWHVLQRNKNNSNKISTHTTSMGYIVPLSHGRQTLFKVFS